MANTSWKEELEPTSRKLDLAAKLGCSVEFKGDAVKHIHDAMVLMAECLDSQTERQLGMLESMAYEDIWTVFVAGVVVGAMAMLILVAH